MVKEFWKSKTLWTNVLIVLAGVGAIIAGQLEAGIPITVAGIMNAILRVITEEGIQF